MVPFSPPPSFPRSSHCRNISFSFVFCFCLSSMCSLAYVSCLPSACVTLVQSVMLCLFPHLVSKERMCFFPPLYHPPFPHSEKKDACLSAQLSKLPNKIKDLQYFYVYIRPSMTASLSKAIFECETSQTTICLFFFFLIRFLDISCLFVLLFTGICLSP